MMCPARLHWAYSAIVWSRSTDIGVMADPFEVRMKFSHQLGHLGASTTSAQKAAHYALRHKDLDEDLHSCIIENVERVRINGNSSAVTPPDMSRIP